MVAGWTNGCTGDYSKCLGIFGLDWMIWCGWTLGHPSFHPRNWPSESDHESRSSTIQYASIYHLVAKLRAACIWHLGWRFWTQLARSVRWLGKPRLETPEAQRLRLTLCLKLRRSSVIGSVWSYKSKHIMVISWWFHVDFMVILKPLANHKTPKRCVFLPQAWIDPNRHQTYAMNHNYSQIT